jgi:asparagine synthase (glutamine-hydrolysing)
MLSVFAQGAAATRRFYHAHGLELVTPYWDRRLVEFALALPADQLGRPHRDRWVHRNAMNGLLPEPVRERSQRTIFVPLLEKGLLEKERTTLAGILHDPQIVQRDMVRADWLEGALRSAAERSTGWDSLWPCISLELWLSRFW